MKNIAMLVLAIVTAAATPALAQDRSKEPAPPGGNAKSMEACKADIQKYCKDANLKQECLVAQWTHISGACQDALARPMHNGG
jgi:hypothetical protein